MPEIHFSYTFNSCLLIEHLGRQVFLVFLEHSDEGFMKLKILAWDNRKVHLYYNKRTYAVVKIKQGVDRVSLEVREERE